MEHIIYIKWTFSTKDLRSLNFLIKFCMKVKNSEPWSCFEIEEHMFSLKIEESHENKFLK